MKLFKLLISISLASTMGGCVVRTRPAVVVHDRDHDRHHDHDRHDRDHRY